MGRPKSLRAIDLYSGVGGWSLGLQLAGIKVVASYERSVAANRTNNRNNRHGVHTVDIRTLRLSELPQDIDVVVGSPPCTQFSFANRGGNGNIADGLVDLIKFLKIVDYIKPKHWAMENVPRVAKIIEKEIQPGGKLRAFAHLLKSVHVVNMEDFGLPQRRRRCIAGNFDFQLLETYKAVAASKSLGEVVSALRFHQVKDPLYGIKIKKSEVTDHVVEDFLNEEEIKINKANKSNHPVYNRMPFPDSLTRSSRTITATSTRVSRESIIIRNPETPSRFRRLTVRESACLQGFPINYQFFGINYHDRMEMVGNAVPPLFSYLVAHAFRHTTAERVKRLEDVATRFRAPEDKPERLSPPKCGTKFHPCRTFRFAIPNLHMKSGVRFELANAFQGDNTSWAVKFYFGSSKFIETIKLDHALYAAIARALPSSVLSLIRQELDLVSSTCRAADVEHMQNVWAHRGPGDTHPFDLLDQLSVSGKNIEAVLRINRAASEECIEVALKHQFTKAYTKITGIDKLRRLAPTTLAGLMIGSLANMALAPHSKTSDAEHRIAGLEHSSLEYAP
jgi:DNA (cytosine-5)-methyltransferase 1